MAQSLKHFPVFRAVVKNASNFAHVFVEFAWINVPSPFSVSTTTLGDIAEGEGPLRILLRKARDLRVPWRLAVSSLFEWLSAVYG